MARASIELLLVLTIFLLGGLTAVEESSYRLPKNAEPVEYDLHLAPDLGKFTFNGEAQIKLKVLEVTKTLTLNAKNLNIVNGGVQIDDKNVQVAGVREDTEKEMLHVDFDKNLEKNKTYQLTVTYTGVLNDQKRGFYRSRYFNEKNEVRYVAATHFEPTGARLAFPCFDEPGYKTPFTISLTYSNVYKAIANTEEIDSSDDKQAGTKTSIFKTTPAMSTYLVAFVVSDYDVQKNGNLRAWTKPQAVNELKHALTVGMQLLDELGKYTGIPYSKYMNKMDQVSLRDFSAGAMENWGLVTYRESALLYSPESSTTRTKQSVTTIIAHEFAHQWFGNLVSPKWWKYIWLNEGFATYFEYFITHKIEPEWRLPETFVVNAMQLNAFVADARRDVRPINHDANTPQEISKLFDSIAYQKAGSIIRMMSHILTPDVFQNSLRKYLDTFKLKNTDSDDLLLEMQLASLNKTIEGQPFQTIMNNWLNKPGYPVVNVKNNGYTKYEISQERFTIENEFKYASKDDTKWWVPLTYVKESSPNFEDTNVANWLKGNNETLTLNIGEKDKWIIFNTQQTGYYRVNYDEENWKLLTKQLRSENFTLIPPVNRAQLVDDALNMARTSRLNYTDALLLTMYLTKENDYVPWQTAFTNLNFLRNMLRKSVHYHIFDAYLRHVMNNLTDTVGFEPKEKDADLTKLLRVNAMKVGCRAKIEKCVTYVNSKFQSWIANNSVTFDVDLKNNIICAGVRNADEKVWNATYRRLVESTKDEDERKTLVSLLACSNSVNILKRHLSQTISNTSYPVTFDSTAQSIISEHLNGVDIVLDILIEKQEEIEKLKNGADMIKSSVEAIASAITETEQLTKLTKFVGLRFEEKPLFSAVTKASANVAWIERNRKTIEEWLVKNEDEFNSASSLAFASILVVLSLFITHLY